MIGVLLALAARAVAADAAEPLPVTAVSCQRPVRFEAPRRWEWSLDKPGVIDTTALVVRADPELLRPRDVGQRVLFVEGWPAEVLWHSGDRALVLAPMAVPDAGARVWFGDAVLPETIGAEERGTALGRVAGWLPQTPKARADTLAWPADARRRELVTVLRVWMERCEAGTP